MLYALLAVLAFADAARRLARRVAPRSTLGLHVALALVLASSLLCSVYGVLGALCVRHNADVELVFHGSAIAAPRDSTTQGAGEVRVWEPIVDVARATPRNVALVALACWLASLALRGRGARRRSTLSRFHLAYVPIALAALGALRSVARGYDALWYHLPMAVAFARNGHLEPPGRDLVSYFPADTELLARTLYDLLGAHALSLVQLPFAVALGPLAAGIARRIGGAEKYALALVLGCPIVVFQAGLAYADVVSLAALAAALLLLLDEERTLLRTLAAGLCLGLSLGSKYAALPLLASGAPIIAVVVARRNGLRTMLGTMLALAIGVALPAWFWYARNLRLTGNPLYPIALPWLHMRGLFLPNAFNAGKELELVGSRAEWWIHPWVSQLTHETGFGAAFATLVPLSLVPLLSLLRRRRAFAMPFAWGLVYLACWWLGTPHEVRHLLPLVILLGVPATILLRTEPALRRPLEAALVLGALVIVRIQLFSPAPEESARALSFERFYGIPPDVLDELPDGSKIGNAAGRPYNFALLGPHLTLRTTEYMDAPPSARDLDDQHADFLFVRGPRALIDDARQHADSLARPLVVRWQGVPLPKPEWSFWGASPSDTLVLFERSRSAEKLGADGRGTIK